MLLGGMAAAHAILLAPVYWRLGNVATALTMLPVAAFGLVMGWRGGLAGAALYLPVNALLLHLAGAPAWSILVAMWPGIAGSFAVGGMLGSLSDSLRKSRMQARELIRQTEILEAEIQAHKKTQAELTEINARLTAEIAERKRVSASLVRAEEKHKRIFERTPEGLFQTNSEGLIVNANPALARMFAYESPQELIEAAAQTARQRYSCPGQLTELLRLVRQGNNIEGHEMEVSRKDGNPAWISVDMRVVRDVDGEAVRFDGGIRDITERKRFEAEKTNLESLLRKAQRLETIGTLAGGIAHDFNNVLAIIMGYAELVRADLPDRSREKQNIERALQACNRAKDLVRQILSFCRFSGECERTPIDVRPTIEEVLDYFRSAYSGVIEIRENLAEEGALMLANHSQIHQVLMNLCANAVHAMESTGGVLEVELAEADLAQSRDAMRVTGKPGPYVRLTVRDTGHGMDAATLERIFEPYFTTKPAEKGSGIGLAVVQGIVKSHEGCITVESDPGKGTTFDVLFPGIEKEVPLHGELSPSLPRGTERVLLVDDEALLVDVWKNSLARLGYNVVATSNGLEALEIFRIGPYFFDLVVADNLMPEISGVELAAKISKIRPDIPIILCTGVRDEIADEKIRDSGIRLLMKKPLEWRTVATVMRQILDEMRPSLN